MKLKLERVYLPTETLGSLYDESGKLICKTMELPWRNNKSSADSSVASCIPEGTYEFVKQPPKESRPYSYFRCKKVTGRNVDAATGMSRILIHRITYVKDLLGCIGVGGMFKDLNGDGVPDMIESGKTLQWMIDNLPEVITITISKKLA